MKLYHLKTCDTCRKAIKALRAAGHAPELIDVRADGVPASDLAQIIQTLGWEAVLNKSSTAWRALGDADKADIDAAKAQALMAAHPTLIKRPVIVQGETMTVGWRPAQQAAWGC